MQEKNVRKDYIENIVIDLCRQQLTKEIIDKIAREVVAICEQEKDSSNIKRLYKLLKENDRKRSNVAAAIAECNDQNVRRLMYEQVPTLEKEREDMQAQIAIEENTYIGITIPQIKFFLTSLKKGDVNDVKHRKTFINVMVNRIYLYDDKMTIFFNSSSQPLDVTEEMLTEIEEEFELNSSCLTKEKTTKEFCRFFKIDIESTK